MHSRELQSASGMFPRLERGSKPLTNDFPWRGGVPDKHRSTLVAIQLPSSGNA